jgi:hypothetical protein
MMNTIRKVIIVVPVLITSCQVSEKLKIGPDMPHIIINASAAIKVVGLPVHLCDSMGELVKIESFSLFHSLEYLFITSITNYLL